ncbi:hypothetical protein SAMN06272759_11933 [Novosphingobium sp. B1]|nr:hypothetical protein SAMN06272759_11933 [Novosphingobium sp. B1]
MEFAVVWQISAQSLNIAASCNAVALAPVTVRPAAVSRHIKCDAQHRSMQSFIGIGIGMPRSPSFLPLA